MFVKPHRRLTWFLFRIVKRNYWTNDDETSPTDKKNEVDLEFGVCPNEIKITWIPKII